MKSDVPIYWYFRIQQSWIIVLLNGSKEQRTYQKKMYLQIVKIFLSKILGLGLSRFELLTIRLSSVCSNQLSYRPSNYFTINASFIVFNEVDLSFRYSRKSKGSMNSLNRSNQSFWFNEKIDWKYSNTSFESNQFLSFY